VREPGQRWQHRVKLSEQAVKTSNPGVQQVRRFETPAGFLADVIFDEEMGLPAEAVAVDPLDPTRRKHLSAGTPAEDLLVPVMRGGRAVYCPPEASQARDRASAQLAKLHAGIKRFVNPHQYPVGLSAGLYDLKTRLVLEARGL
jgi:nicotinate phosphoribosyltransferase